MKRERILYCDTTAHFPASAHFVEALEAFGDDGSFFDESRYTRAIHASRVHRAIFKVLRRPLSYFSLNRDLLSAATQFQPTIVLVGKGAFIRPSTLAKIRQSCRAMLVNYATDDPFNQKNSSADLIRSIPHYHVYCSTKRAIMDDLQSVGARNVNFVMFGFKPTVHYPEVPKDPSEKARFQSDVAFIGTADQERLALLCKLTRIPGLNMAIYGGGWDRFPELRGAWRGRAEGREYRLAIGGAKTCLGIVRRANRDWHTMRTFEIPACGGLLLAERTVDHVGLFTEGREAVFYDNENDIVSTLRKLVSLDEARARISAAGTEKVMRGGHSYTDRLQQILEIAKSVRGRE